VAKPARFLHRLGGVARARETRRARGGGSQAADQSGPLDPTWKGDRASTRTRRFGAWAADAITQDPDPASKHAVLDRWLGLRGRRDALDGPPTVKIFVEGNSTTVARQ